MSQTAADELQRRLVSFAVKIIELVVHLPKTPAGRHVSGQIPPSLCFGGQACFENSACRPKP